MSWPCANNYCTDWGRVLEVVGAALSGVLSCASPQRVPDQIQTTQIEENADLAKSKAELAVQELSRDGYEAKLVCSGVSPQTLDEARKSTEAFDYLIMRDVYCSHTQTNDITAESTTSAMFCGKNNNPRSWAFGLWNCCHALAVRPQTVKCNP